MVKIGEADLMEHYSLLIPTGATAHIPVKVNEWAFDLEIAFDNASEKKGIEVTPSDEGATITFRKWDSGLGTALKKPVTLAVLQDGQKTRIHGQQLRNRNHEQARPAASIARKVTSNAGRERADQSA